MKVSSLQENLAKGLSIVGRADMELNVRTQTLNLKCGRFENTSGALTPPSSHSSPPLPTPMPSALAHPLRVIP